VDVTIANQAQVFIGALSRRQAATPAPFFKGITGRFLPGHQQAALATNLEGLPGSQAELLVQLERQRQLAVLGYNRSHTCQLPPMAGLASFIQNCCSLTSRMTKLSAELTDHNLGRALGFMMRRCNMFEQIYLRSYSLKWHKPCFPSQQ